MKSQIKAKILHLESLPSSLNNRLEINDLKTELGKLELDQISPIPCKYKAGDRVIYTNPAGIQWDMKVIGFSTPSFDRFIHLDFHAESNSSGAAWWSPHKEKDLKLFDECLTEGKIYPLLAS